MVQSVNERHAAKLLQTCPTLRPHGLQPTRLLHPWDFPGTSTGVGCHCRLQVYAIHSHKRVGNPAICDNLDSTTLSEIGQIKTNTVSSYM